MEEKICSRCKIVKPVSEFHKNSYRKVGYKPECKECKKIVTKAYREKNKDKLNEYNKNYRKLVKENHNFNTEVLSDEERRVKHNLRCRNYTKKRLETDSLFKLKVSLRKSISRSFKLYKKSKKYEDILGISYEDFKIYIEGLFLEGMSWENYGEWHLDHKTPISWAKTEEEVYELNHYSNFQPLWSEDNLIKGNRYSCK